MRTITCGLALLCLALAGAQTVCIDPGHPSEVGRGTAGKHITEIQAVWKVATLLRTRLEKHGIHVVMTKTTENQFVKNRDRAEVGNQAHADLVVRLHCDANADTGFAVYYPDRQGKSQGVTGPSKRVLAKTKPIAVRFHQRLAAELKGSLKDGGLKSDIKTAVGAKQGALTGSIFSTQPVVLIEMVVLTNPKDEAFMVSAKGQAKLADALCAATMAALER